MREITYKDVLRRKEYVKLILAGLISRFGDSVDSLAFTWLVYQVTGSAAWSAIVFAVNQLPEILVLFTFLITTAEAFCIPAGMAIVPKLLPEEYYEYGTALKSSLASVVELVGIALGGVIIGVFGIYTAIFIDAITFFGAAVILGFMRVKEEGGADRKMDISGYLLNLKGGLNYVKKQPVFRNFCLMALLINGLLVPFNSLQGPIVSELLGQDAEFLSIFGVTMVAGSALYPMIRKKIAVRALLVISGISVSGGLYVLTLGAFFQNQQFIICIITALSCILLGVGASIFMGVLNVQFMKVVSKEYMARAGAIFNAVASLAVPVSSFIISGIAAYFTVGEILVVCAVFCVIIFIYIGLRKVRFE